MVFKGGSTANELELQTEIIKMLIASGGEIKIIEVADRFGLKPKDIEKIIKKQMKSKLLIGNFFEKRENIRKYRFFKVSGGSSYHGYDKTIFHYLAQYPEGRILKEIQAELGMDGEKIRESLERLMSLNLAGKMIENKQALYRASDQFVPSQIMIKRNMSKIKDQIFKLQDSFSIFDIQEAINLPHSVKSALPSIIKDFANQGVLNEIDENFYITTKVLDENKTQFLNYLKKNDSVSFTDALNDLNWNEKKLNYVINLLEESKLIVQSKDYADGSKIMLLE